MSLPFLNTFTAPPLSETSIATAVVCAVIAVAAIVKHAIVTIEEIVSPRSS